MHRLPRRWPVKYRHAIDRTFAKMAKEVHVFLFAVAEVSSRWILGRSSNDYSTCPFWIIISPFQRRNRPQITLRGVENHFPTAESARNGVDFLDRSNNEKWDYGRQEYENDGLFPSDVRRA